MRKIGFRILAVAAIACAAMVFLRLAGPKIRERMESMFEEAPDDFPPKWMFNNVSAIRENTERILEALAKEDPRASVS